MVRLGHLVGGGAWLDVSSPVSGAHGR